ncbi:SCF complex F-box protein MET30 [Yamadazyma tenuis ATCC 10573]|uniref:SCF complex F-box protein MET30 n=1 Tax=Candida tenuis (strain ATCC 10573 / BCRC 21748 / CBS 615 / JCM 9827 / NBRC 10315 / NRRL Y-1498 / VKM Y-70) TaxID=590646 RepID=G3B3H0_CANTC|nr:SCF complex F-box protein MET30 [Yamadazyma tenuis ATCC 10573]EGV64161.1 SCF complex F-box protein MET30 [Yamadazyma tenuis ATCC 10573]
MERSKRERQNESVLTPFLTKHIGDSAQLPEDTYHKYCYRHNPDVHRNKMSEVSKMVKIQQDLEQLAPEDQQAITHVWSIFSAAPNQYRRLILQGILSQCCFPTLSFVSSEVSSLIRIDFIANLPVEISLKILCYLDCASLCNAAQVCKKWKSLADDDRVWHHMCEQHIDRKCPSCGWGLPLMHMKRAREEYDQYHNRKRKIEEVDDDTDKEKKKEESDKENVAVIDKEVKKRPWKSVYSERYKVEKNWRKGLYVCREFVGHKDGITCLQFNVKYLITGSYDATIKIWDIQTGACLRTLAGHTKGIRSLVFDNQKLISCGLDSTIKVWNYHTGQCVSTYRGHEDAVVSVDFSDKTIVSGSADNTVKVWHVDSRTCYTLRGHTDWVNSVKIHSQSHTAFSASDDTTVKMWDLETHKCLKTFGGVESNGHVGQVQCVIPFTYKDKLINDVDLGNISDVDEDNDNDNEISDGGFVEIVTDPNEKNYPTHLLTSSLDNTIKVWDVKTGKCIRTQFGHIEGVWSISADTFRIVSGAHDRMIKVWDLQDGKCLHTWCGDASVSCVGLSDSKFAAGCDNGVVKLFCFD